MRAKLIVLLVVVVVTLGITALDYTHMGAPPDRPLNVEPIGKPAPAVSFTTVDTQHSLTLGEFEGKTVLLNFWASWCPPCLVELPMLLELAAQHSDELVLVLLSSDDTAEQAHEFSRAFCLEHGLCDTESASLFPTSPNVYVGWDEDRQITRGIFQTVRYPESVLISPDGVIIEKIVGVVTSANMEDIQKQL